MPVTLQLYQQGERELDEDNHQLQLINFNLNSYNSLHSSD